MATNIQHYYHHQYHGIRVLYVEDEKFSREKLLRVLSRRFTHIHVAIDGMEGLELFQKYQPDLVIADIKMNQMNGLEMIEKIREQNDKVQIIVTTAQDENECFIQSIENNVNHFIMKPIVLDHFLEAIRKSVYQIQLEKELAKQKHLTRAILDFQDNLVFIIEHDEIIEFNQAFADFTGIQKKQPALHKSKIIASYFVEDPNYFYPKDKARWIKELLEKERNFTKVRWKSPNGKEVIYVIKATKITNDSQVLFVCKDITDLEAESRKNKLLAMMDPLTCIFNRFKFEEILDSEIIKAERYDHSFSLIMMDIDHFHRINDQYGHQAGDEALITISTIVQQRIRESDMFARWGGEEFILLSPEIGGQGAVALAESIRSIIEAFPFKNIGQITCSFGIAEFSKGKTKSELLLNGSQALNSSKNNGRNRITLYAQE